MRSLLLMQQAWLLSFGLLLREGSAKHYTTRVIRNENEGVHTGFAGDRRRAATTFSIIEDEAAPADTPAEALDGDAFPDSAVLPTFALVPKAMNNPFFDVGGEGCHNTAERLGVNCLYIGPAAGFDPTGKGQVELLQELLANRTQLNLQGIAVSTVDADSLRPIIERAMNQLGIPVITFDSDAPDTSRIAYVGTDNYFFGTQLAKVLKQVHPDPGQFAIVSASSPNIQERERGVRDHLVREGWQEVSTSPLDMRENSTIVVENMFAFAENHPDLTAIVPVMGAGMRAPNNYWSTFVKAHPEILLVTGDAMPNQLQLLDRQQCAGLVGQLPYEMGVISIETLHQLYTTNSMLTTDPFLGTNVLEHLLIPLLLPELNVDHNLVGELRYVGYTLFALVAALAVGFAVWTFANRQARVVKVAQPIFLILVATGTLIMAAAVLPLGFDDFTHNFSANSKDEQDEQELHGVGICMAPFWLLAFGFSLTFSSLFAKIYRVNLLFEAAKRFGRIESSGLAAILSPLLLLMMANGIILTCWTVLDPLHYVRLEHSGTDGWDRAVSTYGTCQGDNYLAYLIPLSAVNGIMLVVANWIAYKTRSIDEEFAESKYVGMAMMSMLQAALSGIPILLIVSQSPQAYYMVQVFMIFITCSAILLLIFVPKMVLYGQYRNKPEHIQQAKIQKSIRRSSAVGKPTPGSSCSASDFESAHFDMPQAHILANPSADTTEAMSMSQSPGRREHCTCNCHLRRRTSLHNGGTESSSYSESDALMDRSSWGIQTTSTLLQSVVEDEEAHDWDNNLRREEGAVPPSIQKPVDVLKDKSSWAAGTLSTVFHNDNDESDSHSGHNV